MQKENIYFEKIRHFLGKEFNNKDQEIQILLGERGAIYSAIFLESVKIGDELKLEILAFAVGSKSISNKNLKDRNFQLRDFHSEVLARRALILWLLNVLEDQNLKKKYFKNLSGDASIQDKLKLRKGYKFVIYCSRMPCGDCSIIKNEENSSINKSYTNAQPYSSYLKSLKDSSKTLKMDNGRQLEYQTRIKPVRMDFPLDYIYPSISCTDKILGWGILGVQGMALSSIIRPIYFDRIVVPEVECKEEVISDKLSMLGRYNNSQSIFNVIDGIKGSQSLKTRILKNFMSKTRLEVVFYGNKSIQNMIIDKQDDTSNKKQVKNIPKIGCFYFSKNPKIGKFEHEYINDKNGLKLGSNLKQASNPKASLKISDQNISRKLNLLKQNFSKSQKNENLILKKWDYEQGSIDYLTKKTILKYIQGIPNNQSKINSD